MSVNVIDPGRDRINIIDLKRTKDGNYIPIGHGGDHYFYSFSFS